MTSLRWILLLCGLAFIAVLAWWELRRPRQVGRAEPLAVNRSEPAFDAQKFDAAEEPAVARAGARDGEAHRPLPVIEWPELEAAQDRTDVAARSLDDPGDRPPAEVRISVPAVEPLAAAAPSQSGTPVGERPPIVDWPPEGERQICNLRIVPRRQERFAGRSLRQGLQGCGFQHGEFGIFHMPGPDQRVVLSAANLARPGLLDPQNMDYQRFPGINIFAVLPGPLPASEALQQLFDVSSDLAERVDGKVVDDHGVPFDAAQLEKLRLRILDNVPEAARGH